MAEQEPVPPIDLDFAFQIHIDFKERIRIAGPMRNNVWVPAAGGTIKGPKLNGKVVAYSGADYGGEFGLDAHYMLQADDGTYIYIHNMGYLYALNNPPGTRGTPEAGAAAVQEQGSQSFEAPSSKDVPMYFRITPYFNAPVGPHDWLTRTVFVGTGERFQNPDYTLFTYYEVL
jgi:hypothetical protein